MYRFLSKVLANGPRAIFVILLAPSCFAEGVNISQPRDGQSRTGLTCFDPTFSAIHDQLLVTSTCTLSECHGSDPRGGLDFRLGKDAVLAALMEPTLEENGAVEWPWRIVPLKPDESFFFAKLVQDRPPGALGRMPPGLNLLSCQIEAVRTWIENGANDE